MFCCKNYILKGIYYDSYYQKGTVLITSKSLHLSCIIWRKKTTKKLQCIHQNIVQKNKEFINKAEKKFNSVVSSIDLQWLTVTCYYNSVYSKQIIYICLVSKSSLSGAKQRHSWLMTYDLSAVSEKVDENCCKTLSVKISTNISLVASYAGIYHTNFSETVRNRGL